MTALNAARAPREAGPLLEAPLSVRGTTSEAPKTLDFLVGLLASSIAHTCPSTLMQYWPTQWHFLPCLSTAVDLVLSKGLLELLAIHLQPSQKDDIPVEHMDNTTSSDDVRLENPSVIDVESVVSQSEEELVAVGGIHASRLLRKVGRKESAAFNDVIPGGNVR